MKRFGYFLGVLCWIFVADDAMVLAGVGSDRPGLDSGDESNGMSHSKKCKMYRYQYRIDDIEVGSVETADGNTDFYPIFDEIGVEIGVYKQASTNLTVNELSFDCIFNGAYCFGLNEDFASQIHVQGTCSGRFISVTGGTGDFGCAQGYGIPIASGTNSTVGYVELFLCTKLCPILDS